MLPWCPWFIGKINVNERSKAIDKDLNLGQILNNFES